MKKTLLSFVAIIFFINISLGQTIVEIYPSTGNTPISDTIANYQSQTLTQDLIFNLHPGVYEENLNIYGLLTSPTIKVIIRSSTNNPNDVIIQASSTSTAIVLSQAYIEFRNITIESDQATTVDFDFVNGDPAYVTIDSCIFRANTTDNTYNILYFSNYKYVNATNFTISNCIFENGAYAINFDSNIDDTKDVEIINNSFFNQYYDAIKINGINNLIINNNNIELGNANTSLYEDNNGIIINNVSPDLSEGFMKCEINNNRIYKSGTDNVRYIGISLNYCYGNGNQFYVDNNFIDIESADSSVTGILLNYSDTIRVQHNTIKTISPISSSINYTGNVSKLAPSLDFQNNIIVSGDKVFFSEQMGPYSNLTIDNNVYYTPNSANAFDIEGTTYSFVDWSSTFNFDLNYSVFEDPQFFGFNNPMFNNIMLDNLVPKLFGIDYDIDGFTRNTTMCDPGAKEIMFVDLGQDTTICYGELLNLTAPTGNSYTWSTGETTQNITVSNAGTYSVTVQEVTGGPLGIDTINVMVNPEIIVQLINYQDVKCYGDNNGMLELSVSGGVAPYSYTWMGAFPDTNRIENLYADLYDVNISDANMCSVDTFFIVNQPDSIEINFDAPKFCGGCTGFIIPIVSGGTEPYSYSWSSGTTDTIPTDLCEGTYTLTITDDSLCVATDSYSIVESGLAYISGTLSYSGGNIAEADGKVELYKHYVDGASQLELADVNVLGTNGFFEFTAVDPEEFYLRGIVTSGNSVYENIYTSYYLNGGDTTIWEGATALSMACEDTITNLNFIMYELPNTITGPGVFSGTITYGDGQTKSTGEPVPGAEVFVEQEPNDEPIANTTTDTTGTWSIDNIPVGTGYHLVVDIPGLPLVSTYSGLIVEGGDTINNELNFFVDTLSGGGIFSDTATIIIEVNSQDIEIKTYPNPVSSYLTIETELTSNVDISYQIIDINGREIITKEIGNYQGRFVEQIDMNNFENGVYFIKLKLDNTYYIKKFIKE